MITRKICSLFCSVLTIMVLSLSAQNKGTSVVPEINSIVFEKNNFQVTSQIKITFSEPIFKDIATYMQASFKKEYSLDFAIEENSSASENIIYFQLDMALPQEGYTIDVQKKQIICKASSYSGAFYAVQSLLQMVELEKRRLVIPCGKIEDSPRFAWRGLMIDVSRHFFDKDVIKTQLDVLARLKMNRFHLHLTDQEGWRIEIKKYPLLTQIGGKGVWSDRKQPAKYYTQEDIKEIVAYAQQRNIMVIPEIDMPGHANAASRAYPELSGGGEGKWAGFTFHPTKESTYKFIEDVLAEVGALFPSPYIHIGGDEVHYGNQSWYTDSLIQNFIKINDLKDEVGLEHYFVRRVYDIIKKQNKIMIGWDEIINAGISPENAVVMWWRHDKPELFDQALSKEYNVIMCPRIPCYFDFVQDETHTIGRRWTSDGNYNHLSKVYHFPDSLNSTIEKYKSQVMGMQANIWTERVKTKERLEFMLYPRLLAIAEDAWTQPKNKDYKNFERRAKLFINYLKKEHINYFNPFDKSSTPEILSPDTPDESLD